MGRVSPRVPQGTRQSCAWHQHRGPTSTKKGRPLLCGRREQWVEGSRGEAHFATVSLGVLQATSGAVLTFTFSTTMEPPGASRESARRRYQGDTRGRPDQCVCGESECCSSLSYDTGSLRLRKTFLFYHSLDKPKGEHQKFPVPRVGTRRVSPARLLPLSAVVESGTEMRMRAAESGATSPSRGRL